jgi:hypothetical protein
MDSLTPAARSRNMSRIRSEDTAPEFIVRIAKAYGSAFMSGRCRGSRTLFFPAAASASSSTDASGMAAPIALTERGG